MFICVILTPGIDKMTQVYTSLLCKCEWTRKSDLWYGNVSEQHLLLCKRKRIYCVYTRNLLCKEFVKSVKVQEHAQDYCACTTLLFMHKSVVHAQKCCACARILCIHKNLLICAWISTSVHFSAPNTLIFVQQKHYIFQKSLIYFRIETL